MKHLKPHFGSLANPLTSLLLCLAALFSPAVFASSGETGGQLLDLTATGAGYAALVIFVLAYLLVMGEEVLHLRKSKPVLVAAGLIWGIIGYIYVQHGMSELSEAAFKHNLLEYAELLLFLLVAMTYINAMEERNLFDALRAWMVGKGFSQRTVFWLTGFMAFFISPIADNLTTALLMCAVVMKVGGDNKKFIALACINIVVAANAGGAFSPFGDITTLMVWQKGVVHFEQFIDLFIPSLVNYLVPAAIMSAFIVNQVQKAEEEKVIMKRGAKRIVGLFLLTIATAVSTHSLLGLPPVLGMMTGLGFLQFFGFYLRKSFPKAVLKAKEQAERDNNLKRLDQLGNVVPFDVFSRIARAEWDTLLFFYGVVLCVGGLGFMGYLSMVSEAMYTHWDVTYANVAVGVLSAIVDNIPVMFAVLTMNPDMALGQWLLVTLTAGVGGSLLSIGSAAGVALMGQARGIYTFASHLKWTPVIALGYAASILVHLWLNGSLF
ncbi:sodium:proton antiporter NhaD [Shewanella insulae]|uniref:Sodium:proton antiporter n=1 Tax=Shewanella insulae TaxID=2681496 RepID=A0A6L7I3I7_9GAMM|nr:sodium:proton antiporter NhaD [Shewanella insulae]MCG9738135.1 sodium:proton antiporter NhaD [Shewanella insulae]MCG9754831.1 sodium:proton antiporter NhaD [Shewanella insulae]MXR70870.1 sodium:proton antiporter [Shewanella insulae]